MVAQDQDQGHAAMPTSLRHVEEALVLVYGIALLPGVLARVRRDEVSPLLVAPFWPV